MTPDRPGKLADPLLGALAAIGGSRPATGSLSDLTRCIASVLGLPYGVFLVLDENRGTLKRWGLAGSAPSMRLRALLDRPLDPASDLGLTRSGGSDRPIVIEDPDRRALLGVERWARLGVGSIVLLPLMLREDLAGCVALFGGPGGAVPAPERIEVAAVIARAGIPIIELARVTASALRTEAERRAIREVTAALLEESDLRTALTQVCVEAQRLSGAGGVAVLLLTKENRYEVMASLGNGGDRPDHILSQALAAMPDSAGRRGRPVEPILLDEVAGELAVPEAGVIRSVLAAPLAVHGTVIGMLQIINPAEGQRDMLLRAISTLADRLAVMIEHVRLHDRQERAAVIEERHRLARDLHDSVTQSIYGVTVLAEAAARFLGAGRLETATSTLRELRDAGLRALREMRVLIFELHPPDLDKLDLVDALRARLSAVEGRSGILTRLDCSGTEWIMGPVKDDLYRIVQEALNNTVNHAQASNVRLRLAASSERIILEIADDGVGFTLEDGRSKGGMGLRGMEERVAALGGTIEIATRPSEGTRVIIAIPAPPPGGAAGAAPPVANGSGDVPSRPR